MPPPLPLKDICPHKFHNQILCCIIEEAIARKTIFPNLLCENSGSFAVRSQLCEAQCATSAALLLLLMMMIDTSPRD
jgi:hypothetical protein